MATKVFATKEFSRFARKARIADALLVAAVERTERGQADANLGGGLFKLRIARPGEGRSAGYRTILAVVVNHRAIFLYGFAKNEMDNVSDAAEADFRLTGNLLQRATEADIEALVAKGELREIPR